MPSNSCVLQTKVIALATILMSIPLLLSFNIKYQWFPRGLGYALLFFWGLVSVIAVPILLAVGIVLWIVFSRTCDRSAVRWGIWGIVVGFIAEIIFIAARYSPPTL
jgi:hypothetical protein